MNYEVAMEMQKICTGETRELTRGQIAEEVIDIDRLTKGFKPERAEKCRQYYDELIKSDVKKLYDVDALAEETEALKEEFDRVIRESRGDDIFDKLYNDVGDFFQVPPFEGLDNIEYGVHEVCVFSILEYFVTPIRPNYDHENCRREYRDSIAERTGEDVADHWIGVYDDLQKRYGAFEDGAADELSFKRRLAACCIVAISAIRDQDSFALDMAQSGAANKGGEIVDSIENDSYREGESDFTDNVVRLFEFVYGNVRELREPGR